MDGKYPQSIYVMNILNAAGKNKDEAQGFSVYFFLNQMDQIEVCLLYTSSFPERIGEQHSGQPFRGERERVVF